MTPSRRLSITDLSPETHEILDDVRQGEPVLVEAGGVDEAVLVDITDYRLLRAAMHAVARRSYPDRNTGLSEEALPPARDLQARYNQIILHYLIGSISLSRAAELIGCSPMELRSHFDRLEFPQRMAPPSIEEAQRDAETALNWAKTDDS
jgi:prevent-host-death family protein